MVSYKALENETNCTPAAILSFPHLMVGPPPRYDFVVYGTLASLYLFVALAVVTDEFLVPAVERLCYTLRMPYDIAGATFLAMAGSSPEFFVHVVGCFITKGDIGVATILGSSTFNLLLVPGVCGLFSGVTIALDWWPLTRDLLWYLIAVCVLSIQIQNDLVVWHEALILVLLYVVNLSNLLLDRHIQKIFRKGEEPCLPCFIPTDEVQDFRGVMDEDPQEGAEEEVFKFFHYPKGEGIYEQFMWVLCWPIEALYAVSIPDCRRPFFRRFYAGGLIMSIVWISVLSYLISWMMTVVGFNLFMPDSIMGLTFLALGSSIPEAVGSIVVVRKGYGSMFICNCISSDTFDIFICLGVPWLIRDSFFLTKGEQGVKLNSSGLFYIAGSLFIAATVLYIGFMSTNFTMNRGQGVVCLITYVICVVFACLVECNVFGRVSWPTCLGAFNK